MPESIVDWVNFIVQDQPQQAVFLDSSGNLISDGDDAYAEDPEEQAADLPGEVIPEVAPDHVKITGVDMENTVEPIEPQVNDLMSPVEIPRVDATQLTIEINDLDVSPPPEPALVESAPRRLGQERKATEKYVPSISGKSYVDIGLVESPFQHTCL
jgi:hypothetical protein